MDYEYSVFYNTDLGYNLYGQHHNLDDLFIEVNKHCIDQEVLVCNDRTGWSKIFPVPCFNPEPF